MGAARAQPMRDSTVPLPVLITIDPNNGCVTAREFLDQVKRRAPRVRPAQPGDAARRFSVTIENRARVVGRLLSQNTDGTGSAREVEGASCQEVTDALALVVAVTLDPLADTSSDEGDDQAVERGSSKPPRASNRPARGARAVPPRETETRWRHALGGEAILAAGLVDAPMPAVGARYYVSQAKKHSGGMLFSVGAFASFGADVPADRPGGGVVRYHLQALSASGCSWGFRVATPVSLHPCVGLTLGRFQAEGIDLPGRQSDDAFFVAGALEGRWVVRVVGPVNLVGSAGLIVPLGTYSVVTEMSGTEQSVGGANPAGFLGSLGLVLSPG